MERYVITNTRDAPIFALTVTVENLAVATTNFNENVLKPMLRITGFCSMYRLASSKSHYIKHAEKKTIFIIN